MDAADPKPSVIASHVDIVYRVYAGTRPGRGWRNRSRRGVRHVHAVKDVSFVAYHGESIGVVGRNGSGKSTLLRAVAGLVPPTKGDVWADGTPSLLGVNAVLVKQVSGARNIYIGAQALGLSKAEVDAVYDDIAEFSGLGDAIHLPMATYSSGMAARLRFAISTAVVPPVLVIDEALATGDAHFRARSEQRIMKLREQAGTVFLVSHSADTIRSMCDRALWLDQGQLVMDGQVDEVVDAYSAATKKSLGTAALPDEPDVPGVHRWYGSNRYETSALASRSGTPGPHDTVVLASGLHPSLALSAVPAAATVDAPVLLTSPDRLLPVTRDELSRLQAERVILLGGTEFIHEEVAADLSRRGLAVERVDGRDAVSTSLALLSEVTADDAVSTIFLVAHDDTHDVLAASLLALAELGRILLVGSQGLTPAHLETVARIRPGKIVVVAEEGIVDNEAVTELGRYALEGAERRLSPSPVLAASEASLGYRPENVEVTYLASTAPVSMCDAVSGAAVASLVDAPLLLVERDTLPEATSRELERLGPTRLVVIGGPLSVSAAVRQALARHRRPATLESELDVDL